MVSNIVNILNTTDLHILKWLLVNLMLCEFYFKKKRLKDTVAE